MGLFSLKKTEQSGWTCKVCKQKLTIKHVGAVMKEGQIIINNSSRDFENIVTPKNEVLCEKCSLELLQSTICENAKKKERPLKIDELRTIELYRRSDSLQDFFLNKEVKAREVLPENSARWKSMSFDAEGRIIGEVICPKCSEENTIIIPDASCNTIEEQVNFFNRMYVKLPTTCPSCANNFTLWK